MAAVRADLNFAGDRSNGGIWSNKTPALTTQRLASRRVTINDASALPEEPTLENEGFARVSSSVAGYAWEDAAWVNDTYLPHCMELVKGLTGAAAVARLQMGVMIRHSVEKRHAPVADFVHLDYDRDSWRPFVQMAASELQASFPRLQIFNIWRAITPPPQDTPLALCDKRTLSDENFVVGKTVEPEFPDGIPYMTSTFDEHQRWYYYPDLTQDDAIIFKGGDSDRTAPMGCLHGAFRNDDLGGRGVPRASVETRVVAFFDE